MLNVVKMVVYTMHMTKFKIKKKNVRMEEKKWQATLKSKSETLIAMTMQWWWWRIMHMTVVFCDSGLQPLHCTHLRAKESHLT